MLQKKGKLSKDARAAASRPCLVIRRPVFVTIRIAGAGDFSLLADDDVHGDNSKLRRTRAMEGVAAPESLTCLSSKPPRSTGCFCERVGIGGRRMMRGSRPSRILTATRPSRCGSADSGRATQRWCEVVLQPTRIWRGYYWWCCYSIYFRAFVLPRAGRGSCWPAVHAVGRLAHSVWAGSRNRGLLLRLLITLFTRQITPSRRDSQARPSLQPR